MFTGPLSLSSHCWLASCLPSYVVDQVARFAGPALSSHWVSAIGPLFGEWSAGSSQLFYGTSSLTSAAPFIANCIMSEGFMTFPSFWRQRSAVIFEYVTPWRAAILKTGLQHIILVNISCIPDKVFHDFHPFWIFPSYTRGCKTTPCMTSRRRR